MRKIATIAIPRDDIRRLMVHAVDIGAYLFLYREVEDAPCDFDEWYDTLDDAERAAHDRFRIQNHDWTLIDDPLPSAQHDWIRPTRVKLNSAGEPLWGQFEAIPAAE